MASVECPVVSFNKASDRLTFDNAATISTLSSNIDYERSVVRPWRTDPMMEQHVVLTSLKIPQSVFISQHRGKIPLVTYHDIGTNHTSFYSFFNFPEMRVILREFTIYHICAPGHQDNALNVTLDTNLYPTMEQLTEMFASILVHFHIKYFVGFGVGAGGNIMTRYAMSNSDNIRGLFLLNPKQMTQAYYPRYRCRWYDLPKLQRDGFFSSYLMSLLEWNWFGFEQNDNSDVWRAYEELARSLNPFNVAGYIQSFLERTDIGSLRPPIPLPPDFWELHKDSVIKAQICLVTGANAADLVEEMIELNARLDPEVTEYLKLDDCNGMVMEESPEKLATFFLRFLSTIRILLGMTTKKLQEAATAPENFPALFASVSEEGQGKLMFEESCRQVDTDGVHLTSLQ